MTEPQRGTPRILMLEDSDLDAELIAEHARRIRPEPEIVRAADRLQFERALAGGRYDAILSDFSLPGFDGMAALDIALELAPETPFIFVSGVLGEEIAIDSFKKGATDYVLKQRLIRLPAAIERAMGEAREKAERRRAETQLKLLVAELSHRVKNTLATVTSIVRRTAASASTVEEYRASLLGRLGALSDAHALLFEASWGETSLYQVLERTLQPFRRAEDRGIALSGPDVSLQPKTALVLSLIFHELVTNALKYGALSVEEGRIDVAWSRTEDGNGGSVRLTWTERGGPAPVTRRKQGFGTLLIERSAQYELDGRAEISFLPTGLVCELQFAAS